MQIVWDWNGTLLDDVEMAVRVTGEVFTRYGYPAITLERYRDIFRFPVRDYYRLCGVSDEAFPEVGRAWSDAYVAAYPSAPLRSDAVETVHRLRDAGMTQLILSATKQELLREQVAAHPALDGMFEQLLGIGDIYATSKTHLAVAMMAQTGLSPDEVVFIGDSCHDAEVASAVGCRCLLVSGGHQNDRQLQQSGAPVLPSLRAAADWILA